MLTEIEEAILNCIADTADLGTVFISPSDYLQEDLNLDSLDIVNLNLYLKEEFQNQFIEVKVFSNTKVQDVIDQVKKFLPH